MEPEFFFAAAAVAAAGTPVATYAVVRWRLRRQLRVSPRVRSQAPITWLAPLSPPARLHRRLRDAAAAARLTAAQAGRGSTLAELCSELERQAIEVEAHLLLASQIRRQAGPARQEVARQVEQLEVLASRLAHAAVEVRSTPALPGDHPDGLDQIAERLEALELARGDLASIERTAGLEPPRRRVEPPRAIT